MRRAVPPFKGDDRRRAEHLQHLRLPRHQGMFGLPRRQYWPDRSPLLVSKIVRINGALTHDQPNATPYLCVIVTLAAVVLAARNSKRLGARKSYLVVSGATALLLAEGAMLMRPWLTTNTDADF